MTSPPGWYPDPQNYAMQRYWNGNQWTDSTRLNPTIPPATGNLTTLTATETSKIRSNVKAVARLIVAVIAIMAVVSWINSSSDDGSPEQAQRQEAVDTQLGLQSDPTLADPATYEELSKRDLDLIMKDIYSENGRRIVLYGSIRQFDSATGTGRFLADIGTSAIGVGNNESAHLIGDPVTLKPFVAGDEVKMFVLVDGEYSYTSTADFKLTVPQFQIRMIEMVEG